MPNEKSSWSIRFARRVRTVRGKDDEKGASLVEYALLLALIAVVAIGALHFLGGTVANTLNNAASDIALGGNSGGGGGTTPTTLAFGFTSGSAPSSASVNTTGGYFPVGGYTDGVSNAVGGVTYAVTSVFKGATNETAHNYFYFSGDVLECTFTDGGGTYTITVTATEAGPPPVVATQTITAVTLL